LVQAALKTSTMSRVPDFDGLYTNDTDWSTAIHVQSEVACGYMCLYNEACQAFFYDNSTLLCKLEQKCRLVSILTQVHGQQINSKHILQDFVKVDYIHV